MLKLARALTVLAALLLAAPWGAPARAGSPDDAKREQAGTFYQEGMDLYHDEHYKAAIMMFEKSLELYVASVTYYGLAKCYEKLGIGDKCIEWFEKYLEQYQKEEGKVPKDIGDIKQTIAKCRMGTRLLITIDSEPQGASVYIDDRDKLLGQTPYKTRLDPGEYTLHLDANGYAPFTQKFAVKAGEAQRFNFKLEKYTRVGVVKVKANIRGANVHVDGSILGRTPYDQEIELPEGPHQITFEKEDYATVTRAVDVKANEKYEVVGELFLREPPGTWREDLGWTCFAFGLVFIGGGAVSSWWADQQFKETDDFSTFSGLQYGGYIGGGVLLGAGILFLILESTVPPEVVKEKDALEESSAPRLLPLLGAGKDGGTVGAQVWF